MDRVESVINCFLKIFIALTFLLSMVLSATENQRVIDELASPMPHIPLKYALGEEAYNDAIGSGKYRYVGNSKCRLCHRKFFLGRKKDPHDHAMKELIDLGYEENANCLTCHSTGFGTPTGFVSHKETPRLSNVQCEGCHGPGNLHVNMAKKQKRTFVAGGFLAGADNPAILKNMCKSCHTKRWDKSYHDLDKAYNKYKKADPNSKQKSRYR